MGAKEIVRELLDRLPDGCGLEEVIDQLCMLEASRSGGAEAAPLTDAQRLELERRLDLLDGDQEPDVPWREAVARMRR